MRNAIGAHVIPELRKGLKSWLPGGPHPAPVLWLKFGEGKGDVCKDSSPEGNDGAREGPTWVTGLVDNALSFDGVNDYVQVPHSASLNISDVITLEAWIYMPARSSDLWGYVLCKYTYTIYGLIIGGTTAPGDLQFWIGNSSVFSAAPHATLSLNTWYHVVATFDGSVMKLYINGALNASTTVTRTIPTSTEDLFIGDRYDHTRHFKGVIDEVRIYNRALSAREILRHYKGVY